MAENINNAVLSEQLKGLTTLINAQFIEVHTRLDKINGKVGKHEEQINEVLIERARNREEQKNMVPNHIANCPLNGKLKNLEDDIEKIENIVTGLDACKKKIDTIETSLQDVNFYMRHPKLFVAGIVIVVLLTAATFLTNNPLKVFDKVIPNTEINVQE